MTTGTREPKTSHSTDPLGKQKVGGSHCLHVGVLVFWPFPCTNLLIYFFFYSYFIFVIHLFFPSPVLQLIFLSVGLNITSMSM